MKTAIMKTWSDDMGEISGFGGGYEATCRAMVLAGIQWVDDHQNEEPVVTSLRNVYGLAVAENEAARLLEEAMMSAPVVLDGRVIQSKVRDDCTGAMHHAAMQHVLAYRRLGWDEYSRQLKERPNDD